MKLERKKNGSFFFTVLPFDVLSIRSQQSSLRQINSEWIRRSLSFVRAINAMREAFGIQAQDRAKVADGWAKAVLEYNKATV